MVQDYVSPVRVHKYTFEMVMAAYERRFPSCPQIPVVVDCEIIEDCWSKDNSQRWTTRRCKLTIEAPYLIKKMIGTDFCYFMQKNHLDLKARTLEIEATNETFATKVEVLEKCRYFVHPDNPDWTCFEQTAILDVKSFLGLESTVEKISMKQYAANIAKGKELIEVFMQEVYDTGVKELRPWSETDPEYNRELRNVLCRGVEPLTEASPEVTKPLIPAGSRANTLRKRNLSFTDLSELSISFKPSPYASTEDLLSNELPKARDPGYEGITSDWSFRYAYYTRDRPAWVAKPLTVMPCTICSNQSKPKEITSDTSVRSNTGQYSVRDGVKKIADIERQLEAESLTLICGKGTCPNKFPIAKDICPNKTPSAKETCPSKAPSAISAKSSPSKDALSTICVGTSSWDSLLLVLVSVVVVGAGLMTLFRYLLPIFRRRNES